MQDLDHQPYRQVLRACKFSNDTHTLGDEKTLKSNGLIPLYYKSLYGLWTLNPFRVHFVFKDWARRMLSPGICPEPANPYFPIWYLMDRYSSTYSLHCSSCFFGLTTYVFTILESSKEIHKRDVGFIGLECWNPVGDFGRVWNSSFLEIMSRNEDLAKPRLLNPGPWTQKSHGMKI